MKIKKLIDFLSKHDSEMEVDFGIVNQTTETWHNLEVMFLCDEIEMDKGHIGIQFEEPEEYYGEKLDSFKEKINQLF